MAHGDEIPITRGPLAGSIRRIITIAAGTDDAVLVPGRADKVINLRASLLESSAAADFDIKENGGSTTLIRLPASAGAVVQIEKSDQIATTTKGKALIMERSDSTALDGYIIYDYSDA